MDSELKNDSMRETQYMSQCFSTGKFFSFNLKKSEINKSKKNHAKKLPDWKQSSSTWRHTSYRYSIPKSKRQKPRQLYYSEICPPQLKSTRTQKTCSLGKGKRQPISQIILRNAKEKPCPTNYSTKLYDQAPRIPQKGKSFGISWQKYQKTHILHRKDVYAPYFVQDNAPAMYDIRQQPGKDKKFFSLYGRQKMFTQKMSQITKDNPGPIYDIKDRHLYGTTGLNERNFGFGQRIDFSKPANHNPGPKYNIPGFCDKFENLDRKGKNQQE